LRCGVAFLVHHGGLVMEKTPIRLERALAASDEVRDLIGELDRELSTHYSPEQRHGLCLDAIFQPHIRFFVAWTEDGAMGCGGVALFSGFAEIKRMYVRPAARGAGIADAILERLTAEAAGAGLDLLRLETGTRQERAIRFYARNGFKTCGSFEPYTSMPPAAIETSVFMEKSA
jgi:putative acetyltransferase